MSKKVKKETAPAYGRVDNHQKFSTFRLTPGINQKNYFTSYLKKDSQFLCRKNRERDDPDDTKTVVFHVGSRYIRVGFNDDNDPQTLPFCVAKSQELNASNSVDEHHDTYEEGLEEIEECFKERMKYYKIEIKPSEKECSEFNATQIGEESSHKHDENIEDYKIPQFGNKIFCNEKPLDGYNTFFPLVRGVLNENPKYYKSPEELKQDIEDIFNFISIKKLDISDLRSSKNYDAILVIPDLFERKTLSLFVETIFSVGFQNVAIIEEAVAATYGAGISAGCVIDIGAQTTSVCCVDEGMCIANSRIKLDFGSDDLNIVFGKLLKRIKFPGDPTFLELDDLKKRLLTINEYEIAVQLSSYYKGSKKYNFKIYDEVALPVLGLFFPKVFSLPSTYSWRNSLFPRSYDPYTQEPSGPISDAEINIRMGTLSVHNQSYKEIARARLEKNIEEKTEVDDEVDDDEGTGANVTTFSDDKLQIEAYESLVIEELVVTALDLAISVSIAQAQSHSASSKMFYENLLVVGGGSKIASLPAVISDRLYMLNQIGRQDIGDVTIMAMPKDTDPAALCWKGGTVYSKLKIVDEMWTSAKEWSVLGSRTLYYKAALYTY